MNDSLNTYYKDIDAELDEFDRIIQRHNELLRRRENISQFIERYSAQLCGPSGIFGVIDDEIILMMLAYLPPRDLLCMPCKRFYDLREIYIRRYNYNMPDIIVERYISRLFVYPIAFHIAFRSPNYTLKKEIQNNPSHKNMEFYTIKKSNEKYVYKASTTCENFIGVESGNEKIKITTCSDNNIIYIYTYYYRVIINMSDFTYAVVYADSGSNIFRQGTLFHKINRKRIMEIMKKTNL
jgi:hypothetical protein